MRKILYLILALAIFIGVATIGFQKNAIEECNDGCSCCESSCNCQPKICAYNTQQSFFIEEAYTLPGLILSGFLFDDFVFIYNEKPPRSIFHPPRYS